LPPHTAHKPMRWKSKPAPSVDWLTNAMRRRSGVRLRVMRTLGKVKLGQIPPIHDRFAKDRERWSEVA
jgi:predicted FMN-binding regulatory protein PaiB